MTTEEFLNQHGLEPWVGEALDLLTSPQRAAVMNPQMNVARARNMNGIVVSRIKRVVPLDERLSIFVQINGLSDGVVDRISTLTPDQAEILLETGFKILRADNTSAVAMKRITDVIRGSVPERAHRAVYGDSAPPRHFGGHGGLGGPGLGGPGGLASAAFRQDDRSRTPGPRGGCGRSFSSMGSMSPMGAMAAMGGGSGMPPDLQEFMDRHGLEWWCGEVLQRLSLFQRQTIMRDLQTLQGVRNPSGVVMAKVKTVVDISELMSIFVDLNQFDRQMQEQLLQLNPDQQMHVINPGIYLQNVRNPNTAVRSRINNVLKGLDAFGKPIAM